MEKLGTQDILDARLEDWRKLAQAMHARYRIESFTSGAAFATAIAKAAEAAGRYPDLKLTRDFVDISLCTHEDGLWVTRADVEMARAISDVARAEGLAPDPSGVTQIELALDSAHEDHVGPFWSALLTGSPANKVYDSVFDPDGRVPSLWFQGTDDHDTPRQRWHFDLWLAPEEAEVRIEAAVAAGGSVIDDAGAPSFTVLADPERNKVCVCTYLARS